MAGLPFADFSSKLSLTKTAFTMDTPDYVYENKTGNAIVLKEINIKGNTQFETTGSVIVKIKGRNITVNSNAGVQSVDPIASFSVSFITDNEKLWTLLEKNEKIEVWLKTTTGTIAVQCWASGSEVPFSQVR